MTVSDNSYIIHPQHSTIVTESDDTHHRPGQTKEKEHGRLQQLKLNQLGTTEFSYSFHISTVEYHTNTTLNK